MCVDCCVKACESVDKGRVNMCTVKETGLIVLIAKVDADRSIVNEGHVCFEAAFVCRCHVVCEMLYDSTPCKITGTA